MADAALAVRTLHALAMAAALGGAATLALVPARAGWRAWVPLARRYEKLFWGAMALLVLTGAGNLGAFATVPRAGTAWGGLFLAKLALVLALLALSLARTLAVARLARTAGAGGALGLAYAGTAALLALIAGLGLVLAHG